MAIRPTAPEGFRRAARGCRAREIAGAVGNQAGHGRRTVGACRSIVAMRTSTPSFRLSNAAVRFAAFSEGTSAAHRAWPLGSEEPKILARMQQIVAARGHMTMEVLFRLRMPCRAG